MADETDAVVVTVKEPQPVETPAAEEAKPRDWGEVTVAPLQPIVIPDEAEDPHGYDLAMIEVRKRASWSDEGWSPTPLRSYASFDPPVFGTPVEPDPRPHLEPFDPRLGGWRLYDPDRAVAPDRYLIYQGTAEEPLGIGVRVYRAPSGIFYKPHSAEVLWENPVTGELQFSAACKRQPWGNRWEVDNLRIATEIARRTTCICGAEEHKEHGLNVPCYCELRGWTRDDPFWTELIKPITADQLPPRKLPAQYPMYTSWSRLRDWFWRLTHRSSHAPQPASHPVRTPVPLPEADPGFAEDPPDPTANWGW